MKVWVFGNDGPLLQTTKSYWNSEAACRGFMYVSWNAGAVRLLVPDSQLTMVPEMKTEKDVMVSAGATERGKATSCCLKTIQTTCSV